MTIENSADELEGLRAVPVFSELEPKVLGQILDVAERRRVGSGALLIQRGDRSLMLQSR